jgi:hypothetical protein
MLYDYADAHKHTHDTAVRNAQQVTERNGEVFADLQRGGDPQDLANGRWVEGVWVDTPFPGVLFFGAPGLG